MKPKVSVVIPAHNRERYIRECVDSALAQDYPNLEVVVVDDGSTDSTPRILADYGGRIRLITQANGGTASALNRGIREASGSLIAWLSSDDAFLPEKLSAQVALFESDPSLDLVYTDWVMVDSEGRILREVTAPHPQPRDFAATLLAGNFINGSSVMVRKESLAAAGYFDECLATDSDGDMWFKMLKMGCRFGHLGRPLVKYRWHAGNLSHRRETHANCVNETRVRALRFFSPTELFGEQVDDRMVRTGYHRLALQLARGGTFRAALVAMRRSLAYGFSPEALLWLAALRAADTTPGRRLFQVGIAFRGRVKSFLESRRGAGRCGGNG